MKCRLLMSHKNSASWYVTLACLHYTDFAHYTRLSLADIWLRKTEIVMTYHHKVMDWYDMYVSPLSIVKYFRCRQYPCFLFLIVGEVCIAGGSYPGLYPRSSPFEVQVIPSFYVCNLDSSFNQIIRFKHRYTTIA